LPGRGPTMAHFRSKKMTKLKILLLHLAIIPAWGFGGTGNAQTKGSLKNNFAIFSTLAGQCSSIQVRLCVDEG
jgi:hypothetical protein